MPIAANTILVAGLVAATVIDMRTRRIPNALTGAMAGLGFAMALTRISAISPAAAVLGFVFGLALMLPGYALGATGAGDAKLMGAVGAIVGPRVVLTAFLATAIAGGILAVAVAVRRGRFTTTLAGTVELVKAPTEAKRTLGARTHTSRFAYGPAIAIGSAIAVMLR